MATRDYTIVKMHKDYFDKVFEPKRKKLEANLGIRLSQTKFTHYLSKSNFNPKPLIKNRKFAPKKFSNKSRGFSLGI